MVREITVIKKPRTTPLLDKPINFPELLNLHLDLMENKKKLKKGLPTIMVVKKKPVVSAPVISAPLAAISIPAPVKNKKEEFKPTDVAGEGVDGKEGKDDEDEGEEPDIPEDDEDADDKDMLDELGGDDQENEPEVGKKEQPAPDTTKPAPAVEEPAAEEEEDDPYAGMSPEEREVKEKEEYLWRFRILKKQYKNRTFPEFNEHDDLHLMKTSYERAIREIQLEGNIESYRMYLTAGFMAMEYFCTNWMGINLKGFAVAQMSAMDKYDRHLVELGERSYNRWGSNLPVELRLLGMIILQAGVFWFANFLSASSGPAVASMFSGMMNGNSPMKDQGARVEEVTTPPAPRKKMRGPSIKVEDIKKMSAEPDEEE